MYNVCTKTVLFVLIHGKTILVLLIFNVSVLTLLENHSRYLFSSAMYLDFNRNDHMT